MGRVHIWNTLRDEDGTAIPSADISIYLAGSTIPATIYLNEIGGSSKGNAPHLRTNAEGYFEFWIGDDNELNGYNTTQKFKIGWDKIGIVSGYIDYIDVFPSVIAVDITSSTEIVNKSVSNALAKSWSDHVSDTSHIVHGIEENDATSNDTFKNKLISNSQAKAWSAMQDTFNFNTGSTPTSAQAHGITKVNPASSDTLKNKLVSNNDIKILNDHTSWNFKTKFETSATNPHGFDLGDETSTDTTPNKLVSNALLKRIKGNSLMTYNITITSSEWTLNGSIYEYTCVHNLGQNYPMNSIFRTDTGIQVIPISVTNIDINTIKITVQEQFPAVIRCSI